MIRISVLAIGSDRMMANATSRVVERAKLYGQIFHHIHTVVFSLKKHNTPAHVFLLDNTHVFFTNSSNRLWYIFDAVRIAKKIYINIKHDTVVVSTQDPFESGLVGLIISKKFNVPLHVQIHTDIGSSYFQKSSILNRIRIFIAGFVLRQAKSVRVVSPSIKDCLVEKYRISSDRIMVLPIVSDFKPEKRSQGSEQYILMVSRLEKEKQIDRALNIFKEVVATRPDVVLKIAGSGREEKNLKQLAKKLRIENKVQFLGDVKDVAPLYAHASCLLHVSQYEGFGMVFYEAMQSRCPIVTTCVGIAPDLQRKNYDISICDIDNGKCLKAALHAYTDSFNISESIHLDFVPESQAEYVDLYKESVYRATRV